jgi:hypothetical protein
MANAKACTTCCIWQRTTHHAPRTTHHAPCPRCCILPRTSFHVLVPRSFHVLVPRSFHVLVPRSFHVLVPRSFHVLVPQLVQLCSGFCICATCCCKNLRKQCTSHSVGNNTDSECCSFIKICHRCIFVRDEAVKHRHEAVKHRHEEKKIFVKWQRGKCSTDRHEDACKVAL